MNPVASMFTNRPLLLLVVFTLVGAFVFTRTIQFFADGWRLPTKRRLSLMDENTKKQRGKEMHIVFWAILFVLIVLESWAFSSQSFMR